MNHYGHVPIWHQVDCLSINASSFYELYSKTTPTKFSICFTLGTMGSYANSKKSPEQNWKLRSPFLFFKKIKYIWIHKIWAKTEFEQVFKKIIATRLRGSAAMIVLDGVWDSLGFLAGLRPTGLSPVP